MSGSLCLYAHPHRESNHLGQTPGLSVRPTPHLGQTRPCGTNQESASGAPQGRTGGAASCPRKHWNKHRNNVASTASPQRLLGPARSPNHTYIRTNAHHSSRMLSFFLVPPCAQTAKKITDTDRQHTSVYIACCAVQCSAEPPTCQLLFWRRQRDISHAKQRLCLHTAPLQLLAHRQDLLFPSICSARQRRRPCR